MKKHGKVTKTISPPVPDQALPNNNLLPVGTDRIRLSSIAEANGLTPAEVYRQLKLFQEYGLEFLILDSDYCQLQTPPDLLNKNKICSKIPQETCSLLSSLELRTVTGSTNIELLELPSDQQHAKIFLTEYQTAGRGRYGRQWFAPYASGLCLSIGWRLLKTIENIQLISLLPAVALIRVLHKIGLEDAGVKWPNDVICHGRKLAGVLIEIPADHSGNQTVVIGLGLNVYNRSELSDQIPQPWTAIDQQLETFPSRNELAAFLISELIGLLQQMEQKGLADIRDEWQQYDVLKDTQITLLQGKQKLKGISRGINSDGSLSVEIDGEMKQFMSGEVSLRVDPE